jgi:cysteine desulfurase
VFVSGGTEANNMVITSQRDRAEASFLVAPVEHDSVLTPLLTPRGKGRVHWLAVDAGGRIVPESAGLCAHDASPDKPIVLAIQAANNETGVVQPVAEVVRAVRRQRDDAFILLDAAQAVGRVGLDVDALDVDAVSFSSHKIHGPAGVGVLVLRDGAERRISPLILGGGQERGLRSGTLNVAGVAGLAAALRLRRTSFAKSVALLAAVRDAFEARLGERLGDLVKVNGGGERVPNTSNVRLTGVDGMRLLARLDERGVLASQGSACSSGRPEPSRTLLAMGLSPEQAFSSLRFSFSVLNTVGEALVAADITCDLALEMMS